MTSLLEQMTKGINTAGVMDRKAEKASMLTKVAGESTTPILPKDLPDMYMSHERLVEAVAVLRQAADAVEALIGQQAVTPELKPVGKKEQRFEGKDPEPTAQSTFEARLQAQSEAAQAATFASLDATDDEPEAPRRGGGNPAETSVLEDELAAGEWVCPTHGDKAIVNLKAKGRTFRACDKCDQVEA